VPAKKSRKLISAAALFWIGGCFRQKSRINQRRNRLRALLEEFALARKIEPSRLNDIVA
jgi:hypothetical protein